MTKSRVTLAIVLLGSLPGCGGDRKDSRLLTPGTPDGAPSRPIVQQSEQSVSDRRWVLSRFDGKAIPRQDPPIVLVIFGKNGLIGGKRSCNTLGSAAEWHSNGTFSNTDTPYISTAVGCGDELSTGIKIADNFWRKMKIADRWVSVGESLTINFSDNSAAEFTEERR